MTKTRIKEIRQMIRRIEDNGVALTMTECITEIETLQHRLDSDVPEPILDDEPPSELPIKLPPAGPKTKARGTLEEFRAFAKSIDLPESDGEAMFWKFEASGWKNGRDTVKDWRAVMRQWKAAGYHPSQKQQKPQNGANHQPPPRTMPAQMIL